MIYLYKCDVHGEFEFEHSINDKLEECPKCKEENICPPNKVTRLICNSSFILKDGGSGWARNGYS